MSADGWRKPLAVCFDLSGVLIDHITLKPLPEMVRLVRNLHADGRYLAVATRYPEQKAGELLGAEGGSEASARAICIPGNDTFGNASHKCIACKV